MRTIGTVARLQIQRSSLKTGEKPNRAYDPAPLLPVSRLTVTPDGVLGAGPDGGWIVDVHHRAHPETKNEDGLHGVSVGFTSHYAAMRERFGDRIVVGCAGENVIVTADRMFTYEELAGGGAWRSSRPTAPSACGSRCSRSRTRAGPSRDGRSVDEWSRRCSRKTCSSWTEERGGSIAWVKGWGRSTWEIRWCSSRTCKY